MYSQLIMPIETMPKRHPNFIIVGSPKCGTGAISHFLNQHPDIFIPARREPNFFSSDLDHHDAVSAADYGDLFAGRREKAVGESSTWYLYSKVAARRIKNECSADTQIIAVVRDPVALVCSLFEYRRFYASHRQPDLETALQTENEHLSAVARDGIRPDPLIIHREVAKFIDGIERYDEVFGRERVKIVFYEDLVLDVRGFMRDLYRVLKVDESFFFEDRRVNQSLARRFQWLSDRLRWRSEALNRVIHVVPPWPRQQALRLVDRLNTRSARKRVLAPELERSLRNYFGDSISALEVRTGRDLSHWRGGLERDDGVGNAEGSIRAAGNGAAGLQLNTRSQEPNEIHFSITKNRRSYLDRRSYLKLR